VPQCPLMAQRAISEPSGDQNPSVYFQRANLTRYNALSGGQ